MKYLNTVRIIKLMFILFILNVNCILVYAQVSNDWKWPTRIQSIRSDWPNYSSGSYHGGTDFSVALNSPVYATCDGEIVSVRSLTSSYGKHIKVKAIVNGDIVYIRYCHLNDFAVSVGDKVVAGQIIGYSGSTGNSTGPHLHYEVRNANDTYGSSSSPNLNPRNYLPGTSFSYQKNNSPLFENNTNKIHEPFGQLEAVECNESGTIRIAGWAFDEDFPTESLELHVFVGAPYYESIEPAYKITANQLRTDVGNAYPGVGNYHGFDSTIQVDKSGDYEVYVYAINLGLPAANTLLGSKKVNVFHEPIGQLESVECSGNGTIRIKGWTLDKDSRTESLELHVFVGAPYYESIEPAYVIRADKERVDIGNAYPGVGNYHGFDSTIPIDKSGEYDVYVYAINVGRAAANPLLGKKDINIFHKPIGEVEVIESKEEGKIRIRGWTVDKDALDRPLTLHVFVGAPYNESHDPAYIIMADKERRGFEDKYPGAGNHHGFDSTITVDKFGPQEVYVYAINEGIPTVNPLLTSRNVNVLPYTYSVIFNSEDIIDVPETQKKTYDVPLTLSTEIPRKEYKISLNTNGGSITIDSKTMVCKFKEWNTEKFGSGKSYQPGTIYDINDNVTLYAQWLNPTVGILPVPRRVGYIFDGWYLDQDGENIVHENMVVDKELTLYAHWIEEHTHTYTETIRKLPTCLEKGQKIYCCTCGENYVEEIPETGHIGEVEIRDQKDAMIEEEGYTGDMYCKDCGTLLDAGKVIPKLEPPHVHEYTSEVIMLASCLTAGTKIHTCSCGDSYTEEIPATGHVGEIEIRNQKGTTVEEEGYTGDTYCKDCGMLLEVGKIIPKLEPPHGHEYTSEITKPAFCVTEGIKTYVCDCGDSYTEIIPATGHGKLEIRNRKEATIREEGYTGDIYCIKCDGLLRSGEVIEKLPHTHSYTAKVIKKATCTEVGMNIYICNCREYYTKNIPATGHIGETEILDQREATIDEEGYTGDVYCKDCGTMLESGKVVPKLEPPHVHEYTSEVTIPASCLSAGIETYTCDCGHSYTENIPATGHGKMEIRDQKSATITDEGYTGDIYCKKCDGLLQAGEVIAKLLHTHSYTAEMTKKETCTEKGLTTYNCVCGDKYIAERLEKGHGKNEIRNQKDATYTSEGYIGDTYCTDCDTVISKGNIIPMLKQKDLTTASVSGISNAEYTGKDVMQDKLAVHFDEVILKNGTDYTVSYANNVNPGTANLTITGKNGYSGTITKAFDITVKTGFTVTVSGVRYKVTVPYQKMNGEVTLITGMKKSSVTIPETIQIMNQTYHVTAIGDKAFYKNKKVTAVSIPKSVNDIGANAFNGCTKLKKINGAAEVQTIGAKAFYNCKKLESVPVMEKLAVIGDSAFEKDVSLKSMTLGSSVENIGKNAFSGCSKLKTITVNTKRLEKVGKNAFTTIHKSTVIKVPKNKLKDYQKLLKRSGTKKSVKVKGF